MKFIRIIQAAGRTLTRRTTPIRNKKVVNKPSKKLPKTAPKRNLSRNTSKGVKPQKTNIKTRNKPVSRRFKIRPTTGYPLQDISLPIFEDLLEQGYNMITLVAWSGACNYCKQKNGTTIPLSAWLNQLQHEAPIFEAFHVNSQSELKVWDKNGELPDIFVNYEGDTHQ